MNKSIEFSYSSILNEALTKEGIISDCFSVFYNYSIHNQLLAMYQLHGMGLGISPLNTFNGWNKLNRTIKKGSKALYMWMPIGGYSKKVTDEETGEEKTVYIGQRFQYVNRWFSLEQTSGKDFKENLHMNKDFKFENVYDKYNIKLVKFEKFNGNVQGYANSITKELAINPLAEDVEMVILHEVSHIVYKHSTDRKDLIKVYTGYSKKDLVITDKVKQVFKSVFNIDINNNEDVNKLDYALKELEAEITAYIIGSIINANSNELARSRGYIQSYLKDIKLPDKCIKHIFSVANEIVKIGFNTKGN